MTALLAAGATAVTQVAAALSGAASAGPVACSASSLANAVAAVATSTSPNTLDLAAGCTYTLTAPDNATDGGTGLAVITGNVTINGNGATITRSSTSAFRFFDVATGGNLTLSNLTLDNGYAGDGHNGGGAIFNHGGLVATAVTFTNNASPTPAPPMGTSGGAINNSGTLTITASTFTGNSGMEGGGVFNGGGTVSIINSTFTDNAATTYGGGGLVNVVGLTKVTGSTFVGNTGPGGGAVDNDDTITITNSTLVDNVAQGTGGGAVLNYGTATITATTMSGNAATYAGKTIQNFGVVPTGNPPAGGIKATTTLVQSILVNAGTNCQNNGADGSVIVDGGYNIETGDSCGLSPASHSQVNTDPQLQPLASNGGPTQTMAVTTGSPALNVIPPGACATPADQRGVARPQGSGCEAGAYESRPVDQYVSAVYPILLGRSVDPGGLSTWANYLTNGGTAGAFTNGITMSTEGRDHLISTYYQAYLNRAADAGGANTWRSWLANGHTPLDVQMALLTSAEYTTNFGSSNKAFVDALYSNPLILNRPADPGGEATWVGQLNAGASRAAVATSILGSAEAVDDRVSAAYHLVLGRAADPGGMSAWSRVYPRLGYDSGALAGILAASAEFRARFQY